MSDTALQIGFLVLQGVVFPLVVHFIAKWIDNNDDAK